MENKYYRFFESFKDFLLKTGFSEEKDLQGCSESTIIYLESKYEVSFPSALRLYLSFFGEKFYAMKSDFYLNFRVKDIENANIIAKDISLWDELVNNRKVRSDIDLCNMLFIRHDSDRNSMYFIE
jgi:hypothetical protein